MEQGGQYDGECPRCGAPVKHSFLEKHLRNVHNMDMERVRELMDAQQKVKAKRGRRRPPGGRRRIVDVGFVLCVTLLLGVSVAYVIRPELFDWGGDDDDPDGGGESAPFVPFTVTTEDGFVLHCSHYRANESNSPLVMLIHGMRENRWAWSIDRSLPEELQARGYHVVTLDLRGHGDSYIQNGKKRAYDALQEDDYAHMVSDVAAVKEYVDQYKPYDRRVCMIGASLGANIALNLAVNDQDVRSLVLLSPGFEYAVETTPERMEDYGNRSAMLMASDEDDYSAKCAYMMDKKARGRSDLNLFPGMLHGTLLLSNPEFHDTLYDWLERTLPGA